MGISGLLTPTIVRSTAAAMGLTAARFDYDKRAGTLYFSLARNGQVHHIPIPVGKTFTRDQIIDLLFSDRIEELAAQNPAQICADQHDAPAVEVPAVAEPPPG